MIYPRCKPCVLNRDCAMVRLLALVTQLLHADSGGSECRAIERELAKIVAGIEEDERHQEPNQDYVPDAPPMPNEQRPEDA